MEVGPTWKSVGAAFRLKTWQLGVSTKGIISFCLPCSYSLLPKDLLLAGDRILGFGTC